MDIRKLLKMVIPIVAACMLVLWCTMPIQAKEYTKNIGDGNITCSGDNNIYHISGSSSTNNITVDGKNIVIYLEGVNINLSKDGKYKDKPAINIKGSSTVTIYIIGDNYLKGGKHTGVGKNWGKAAIYVSKNATVNILGSGKLTADGGGGDRGAAAIGGNAGDDAGTIIIGDGSWKPTIIATGATGGSGIGAGYEADAQKGIYIYSGTITATGGYEGAGIGGSREGYVKNIKIQGGTITATGGKYAAGIGGGNAINLGDGGDIDSITITGGTITATGGTGAAGIGGGDESEINTITINEEARNSLKITATGGKNGAGIGSGEEDISSIWIKLNNGTITATGGEYGAGIGGGNGTADKIEIYGSGTINATGYKYSCGIGSGGSSDGGKIIIKGNDNTRSLIITAKALWEAKTANNNACGAAAIGSANSGCGDINISNADIKITSYSLASGIGNGKDSSFVVGAGIDITIDNCNIVDSEGRVRQGAGIGAGWGSQINNITITNTTYTGGTIGGSAYSNNTFGKNDMETIYISNSDLNINGNSGQKAGIGSGPHGSIDSITIIDSKVYAKTACGAGIGSAGYASTNGNRPLSYTGGACGSITITGSTIEAYGGDGGAGIGGGYGTSVGNITIEDCPSVTAVGADRGQNDKAGGAGIGGGAMEGCGDITITNSTLKKVEGKTFAAGIGSGGSDTFSSVMWDITCGNIDISGSTVNVQGGDGGAGIGTGEGGQFEKDAYITISDSIVNSTGGNHGAGIGAGDNAYAGRGGEANIEITLSGKSKIVAKGGEGGAGIGGGYDGGADTIRIELSETTYKNGEWLYYVKAYGGAGAAGIGSGGVYETDEHDVVFSSTGHDVEKVYITGGYVYAKGGDDKEERGAGAGIGGGARGGNINSFHVSGGYVEASKGYSQYKLNASADIGTGGDDIRSAEDEDFVITGGTVIGTLSSDPDTITIDGGSVSTRISNAKNLNGKKVYQTTLEIEGSAYTKITNMITSQKGYGVNDIIADGNKRVYLYLPASSENKATAAITYGRSNTQLYYGTTTADGAGWLKKPISLDFGSCGGEMCVDGTFYKKLFGDSPNGTVTYTITGSAAILDDNNDKVSTITKDLSDTKVALYGKALGEYTITADIVANSNVYWDTTVTLTETIKLTKGTIQIVEDASKVYDGTGVENPGVTTNSNGKVTYYYERYISETDQTTEAVSGIPTEAGKYRVYAKVSSTDKYTAATSDAVDFTISPKPVALSLTAIGDGVGASVTVNVSGLLDSCTNLGKVQILYLDKDGEYQTVTADVVRNSDRTCTATTSFATVIAGEHNIKVTYIDYDSNYTCEEVLQSFNKDLAHRGIEFGDNGTKYYGDAAFQLNVTSDVSSLGDEWNYEIIDFYPDIPDAATIDANGIVTIQNAGVAVIKVTLTDSEGYYDTAVAYTVITIKPKEVTVTSFAYEAGDDTKTPVTEAEYGELDNLAYGLSYDTITDTDKDNYNSSTVTLVPVALSETTSVGNYEIDINRVSSGNESTDPFMSRNYKVTYVTGDIKVTKAKLTVNVDDVTVQYGMEPEYTYSCEGLMDWDSIETVFVEDNIPAIAVDTALTNGQDYSSLKPGSYEDVLKATGVSETDNYEVEYASNGTLNITKGEISIAVDALNMTYNGSPVAVDSQVSAVGTGNAYDGEVTYTYFRITGDGVVECTTAPVEVGVYVVRANAAETECYNDNFARKLYVITKATPDVTVPVVEDVLMYEGLKLSDIELPEGWAWLEPDAELSVGGVLASAVYTPSDTQNYKTVTEKISFKVYEVDNSADVPAGNGINVVIPLIILMSAAGVVILALRKTHGLADRA